MSTSDRCDGGSRRVSSCVMLRRLPSPFDASLALAFCVLGLTELRWQWSGFYGGGPAWANVPLVLLATLPLAWRRRFPIAVIVVLIASFLIPQAIAHVAMSFWGNFVPYAVALYSVSAYARRPWDLVGVGGGTLAYALVYLGRPEFRRANEVAFDLLVLGVAAAAGQVARRRGQLEVRNALLVRTSEAEALAAVGRERTRIARELHDVIAHNVSVMLVQTAAAQRLLHRDPDTASAMLDAVQDAGREAVSEMQTLLGVLRRDDTAARGPQPCLARLDELVAQVRDAGLAVDVRREGRQRSLPVPVDMSAYRIVQEGLTNALKHSGAARAEVVFRFLEDRIEVEVLDEGGTAVSSARGGGNGIIGMRERVLLYGGEFEAGNRDRGGFRICARFPIPA